MARGRMPILSASGKEDTGSWQLFKPPALGPKQTWQGLARGTQKASWSSPLPH